jgi:hypothetical protein
MKLILYELHKIPAFAGMTESDAGMTENGTGMTNN